MLGRLKDASRSDARLVNGSTASRRAFPTRMVVAAVAMLAAGMALQLAFYGHNTLSDLPGLFVHRGIGRGSLPYVDRVLEYPVGSGMLLYLAALVAPTPLGVLLVTALASVALCLSITVALERRFGPRAWRWAVGLPVFLYAFQNWDMFAIAALVAGLLAFERGRDTAAGAALGLGAAIKLFPAVVAPPLLAIRLAQGDKRGALRLGVSSAAILCALNLPFVVANASGWWSSFAFQGRRNATWGTAWFYILRAAGAPVYGPSGARFVNVASVTAMVAALGWLTVFTARRQLPPFAAAAAAVAIFLVCSKVYSPTYDVWLVAFFVLLPLSRRLWVTFCLVDFAVYATVYGYFHSVDSIYFVRAVLPYLVAMRTLVLFAVVRIATRPAEASPIRQAARPALHPIP